MKHNRDYQASIEGDWCDPEQARVYGPGDFETHEVPCTPPDHLQVFLYSFAATALRCPSSY
jgi:hypothetical protein